MRWREDLRGGCIFVAWFDGLGEGPAVTRFQPQPTPSALAVALLLSGIVLLGTMLGCEGSGEGSVEGEATPKPREGYVGTEACLACHPDQGQRFKGSHHDAAMASAGRAAVLAPFAGEGLADGKQRWKFVQEADEFWVEVREEGRSQPASSAEPERLRVAYTFGVAPLQQYLVEREEGRFQALPAAWDSRDAGEGGQRWFSLNEGTEAPPGDALHWDALAYNWNSQCASCHSTGLKKNYSESEHLFTTRYAEINVGCEACHGPGEAHQADPGGPEGTLPVQFEPFDGARWKRKGAQRIASRTTPLQEDHELDVCGGCHARRSPLVDGAAPGTPMLDAHRPSLMEPGLYFDDGQIREEVYVWGSFLQSRMHAAGVRCSDCHDPHSLKLRREGNALCTGCHSAEAFDVEQHHGHSSGTAASECVSCHMPKRVYMGVDARGDHAFAMPRPRLNAAISAPQVCATCHQGEGAEWAARAIEGGLVGGREPGGAGRVHWTEALVNTAGARTDPRRWLEIATDARTPEWVRASAWARYAGEAEGAPPLDFLRPRFEVAQSLERLGLIELGRRLGPGPRLELLIPLLDDPARATRVAAAEALMDLPATELTPAARSALARGLRTYREAQEASAERPEAQVNLAGLALAYGDTEAARAALERAIDRAPYFVPAYVNLADLERALGRNAESLEQLRRAIALTPEDTAVRYALGLALHRDGQAAAALKELKHAAAASPRTPRFQLAFALSLQGAGRAEEAVAVLAEAAASGAANGEVYQAWASLLRDAGDSAGARAAARAWAKAYPNDPRAATFREALSSEAARGAKGSDSP